jgi:membrane protein DedA with SNARE-associated domain
MFGIEFSTEGLLTFFSAYAYRPEMVYTFIICFMLCSSFGLPIPEEVVLISAGLIAYLGKNPDVFPPPYEGAEPINVYTLMAVCFFTIWLTDIMIFCIGKFLGKKMVRYSWVRKQMSGKTYTTIQEWFAKYGYWCVAIFRFTPGIRFPGQMFCGLIGVPLWATYGREVIAWLHEFKIALLVIFAVGGLIWFIHRFFEKRKAAKSDLPKN